MAQQIINSPGQTNILTLAATTTGPGNWYYVVPHVDLVAFQYNMTGTSAATTLNSTCVIEGSVDGITAGATLATLVISGTTPQSISAGLGTTLRGYPYIRAMLNTASSTTAAGGGYSINIIAAGKFNS